MNLHFSAPLPPLDSPLSAGDPGELIGAPSLIFRLGAARLALPALAVREVHMLPLLSPLPQAPSFVVGILDLRGAIVPVIDLNARLGQPSPPLQTSDALIVLDWNGAPLALLVNEILAVNHSARPGDNAAQNARQLSAMLPGGMPQNTASPRAASSVNAASISTPNPIATAFVAGVTRIDGEIVLLLDLTRLLDFSLEAAPAVSGADFGAQSNAAQSNAAQSGALPANAMSRRLEPQWTPAEREILQTRALRLRDAEGAETSLGAPRENFGAESRLRETGAPVAVFALGGEEFALPLEQVREFTWISSVASVPCCPPHILGQINLRGDIVTLLDVRQTLRTAHTGPPFFAPPANEAAALFAPRSSQKVSAKTPISSAAKASADRTIFAPAAAKSDAQAPAARVVPVVVVQHEGEGVGIAVDEVRDVLYLRPEAWSAPGNAGENERGGAARHPFFAGGATYQGRLLPFLDIAKLLEAGGLEVDESA